jgi:hypothetical protein
VADFTKARDMFDAVAALALQKKENATKSLADTKETMTASEQKAADAQKTLKEEGF